MAEILESFVDALKQQIEAPKADLELNIRCLLKKMITQLELVSQEELELQKNALKQANQRLDALKLKLVELEGKDRAD